MDRKQITHIFKNYSYLLILGIVFRFAFYIYNHGSFHVSNQDFFLSLYGGLRFDFAATSMLFSLYLLSLLTPFSKLHRTMYLIASSVLTYLYLVDIEFYQFVGKRLRIDVFGEGGDFFSQMVQITMYYWPMAVIFFSVLYFLNRLYKKSVGYSLKKSVIVIALIVLNFIAIRGGLQLKSISPQIAFTGGNFERGVLTLNPVYTFFRTLNDNKLSKVGYFSSDAEAINILKTNAKNLLLEKHPKQNIVVIILESFSMEYLKYAPFLNTLKSKSLYFEKGLAGGRRSMEAMPSIFQSFPSLISEPIYKSNFQTNKSETLSKTLKDSGYQTAFFHGGKLGTMGFDSYSLSIGFDRYYSMNDYPNQDHYDGTWGIYDHYFFSYFQDELSKMKEPFLASIFSLSSHHPYSLPKGLNKSFPKGELPIHQTIGYADFALKSFFEKAKNSEWFKNTLFIITADHSQKRITTKYQNIVGEYRVPIYFYHPEIDLTKYSRNKIAGHVDIYPSILDFLGIQPKKQNLFGRSLFEKSSGEALFHSGDIFFYLKDNQLTAMGLNGSIDSKNYDFQTGKLTPANPNLEHIKKLKAYIQYTHNGLRNDQLYLPKP